MNFFVVPQSAVGWLLVGAWLASGLPGCGSLRAPVDFAPIDQPPPDGDPVLGIQPVEGRPEAIVLQLWCDCQPPRDGWVEVLRRADGASTEVYRSVRVDAKLRDKLHADRSDEQGLTMRDRSVAPGATIVYQLRLRTDRGNAPGRILRISAPLTVHWRQPPGQPTGLSASSRLPGRVELRWRAPPGTGALIFRRNVLDKSARPRRLGRAGPGAEGIYVDDDLQPGGVYAYQVALALNTDTTVQFGRPSDEIYVTVCAAAR